MKRLSGKTILIGKDLHQGKLRIAIHVKDQWRATTLATSGVVPNSVSRCKPEENSAHCKIEIDSSGDMIITNLKPLNVTYVDGLEIVSKKINETNSVSLGMDKYILDLSLVINEAVKLVGVTEQTSQSQQAKAFDIAHLEYVWNDFQENKRKIAAKTKRINLIRSGCGIFTMCVVPCCFFFGPVAYVLTAIGVIGNIYSFVGLKNDNSAKKLEDIKEKFEEQYVCPNPNCNKFLGHNVSYKLLKRQYSMHCPYCKSKYIEQ